MFRVLALGVVLAVTACATPTVVDEVQIYDNSLNCQQIYSEYQLAQKYEQDARDERGVTGTNVLSVILWWPGLIATYLNTEDAIEAAQDRQEHLIRLGQMRGCR